MHPQQANSNGTPFVLEDAIASMLTLQELSIDSLTVEIAREKNSSESTTALALTNGLPARDDRRPSGEDISLGEISAT